jgi:hypothetical protein
MIDVRDLQHEMHVDQRRDVARVPSIERPAR